MFNIIKREWNILIHERTMVFIVLLCASVAYVFLIGNLYNGHTVQHIPVAVCDMEQSSLSRDLVHDVETANPYELVAVAGDETTVMDLMDNKKVEAILIIPQDFSEKLAHHEQIQLAFISDGSNTLHQGYASAPMQEVVGTFSAKQQMLSAAAGGAPQLPSVPVQMSLRIMGNPTQSYSFFYLYGVMITASQIGLMIAFALAVYCDFRKYFFYHHGIVRTLVAKEIIYVGLSFIAVLLGISAIVSVFHMPFEGNIWAALFLCFSFSYAVANLAGVVALYFKTKLALVQCLVFYALPAFLMSGYIWPDIGMLAPVKWVSYTIPLHYICMDFRAVALTGTVPDLWLHCLVLQIMGTVGLLIMVFIMHCRQCRTELCRSF